MSKVFEENEYDSEEIFPQASKITMTLSIMRMKMECLSTSRL